MVIYYSALEKIHATSCLDFEVFPDMDFLFEIYEIETPFKDIFLHKIKICSNLTLLITLSSVCNGACFGNYKHTIRYFIINGLR